MAGVQETKRKQAREGQQVPGTHEPGTQAETGKKVKAELDGLLDEIDGVLETNAEEFVKAYVQKGGE